MDGRIRPYSEKKDRADVDRIWKECGWLTEEKEAVGVLMGSGRSLIYEYKGSVESFVTSASSKLHYGGMVLDHAAITSVATSRIARNLGAASATLAATLAEEAERGCATSSIGVFEQGFYDRLGYGAGSYEHWIAFDPAWLVGLPAPAVPRRLDVKDFRAIHQARLHRRKPHGAVDLLSPEMTRLDLIEMENTFCLGYKKGNAVSHCVLMFCSDAEQGPYSVRCLIYSNLHQLLELLALIKNLSDQVRQVRLREPRGIQMQDFLEKPFQLHAVTKKGEFETGIKAFAYWQLRILDLRKCIQAMRCREDFKFNLIVDDPITGFLPDKSTWKGCAGSYTVTLGSRSSVRKGVSTGLETLSASIGDFSRYWFGVQSAEVLNVSGKFEAPRGLLDKLDAALDLPSPSPDWDC